MIKPSTLTVMIGRLEKAGFIMREQDPRDRRMYHIHISAKGREILAEAVQQFAQIEKETFASFTAEERKLFNTLALRIRDNLKQVISCQ
jgi:DNA-binding MarR family transcriptional regulator